MKGLRLLTAEKDFDAMVELKDKNPNGAKDGLRTMRETECFKYVDRAAWMLSHTAEQQKDIQLWRIEWNNVTDTFKKPEKPWFL